MVLFRIGISGVQPGHAAVGRGRVGIDPVILADLPADFCEILHEYGLGFAVLAGVDDHALRLVGNGILDVSLHHVNLVVGDADRQVVQQFAVSFRGQRPGFLGVFVGRGQIIDLVVYD